MDKKKLIELIQKKNTAPFLFLGSGFTKHYLSTPKWDELLAKFASKHINAYYTLLGTKDLTLVASEVAKEVNLDFWNLPDDDDYKNKVQELATDVASVLKHKISDYLKPYSIEKMAVEHNEEIELLQSLNIDGIITTNWDDLIESIFPKFERYVGQEELIFAPTYNIGEIYKIHGSIYQPESLVLTKEDYDNYNKKNAYLAAKLTTIFIEHPIIFMGYSMSDPNVQEILESIVNCLSEEKIQMLQDNLFFVEWNSDKQSEFIVQKHDIMTSKGVILPVTRIITHEYKSVYECLNTFERNIPTHILRFYKKNFYKIVYSEKPEKQLCVIDEKDIDKTKDVQFVLGFGAIDKYKSAIGYTGLKSINIFRDVVTDSGNYEAESIITKTLPDLRKQSSFIPCYKYLSAIGITDTESFQNNRLGITWKLQCGCDFRSRYSDPAQYIQGKSVAQIIKENPAWKACIYIPYMDVKESDLPIINQFCKDNFNEFLVLKKKPNYSSQFKKLVCFYDWKKYGWCE